VPQTAVGLARCRADAGETADADALLEGVLAKHPGHAAALRERGILLLHQGRPADAEPWLQKSYFEMPQEPATGYNLYLCLQQLGKDREAKEQLARYEATSAKNDRLRQLIHDQADRPNDPKLLCEIGALYLETGRPEWVESARIWLERALAADPTYKPTYTVLARYYDQTNRPDLAARCRAKGK
jgi:predicted Zn-dependent protease